MSTQPNTTDSTSQSFKDKIVPSIMAFSSSSSIVDALWSLLTQSVSAIRSSTISPRYTHEEEVKQIHMLKNLLDAMKDMYENTPLKRTQKTPTLNTNASQVTASPHRSDYCSSSEVSNHIIISLDLFTC